MKPNLRKKWSIGCAYAFMLLCNASSMQQASTGGSLAVEQHLSRLSFFDRPIKMITDASARQVYWLNYIGEIHRIPFSGGASERLVGSVGPSQHATFVEDFCLDTKRHRLIFTDLLDQDTGLSAIKELDALGQVHTLVTFRKEIPYQVGVCPRTGQTYFLTKENHASRKTYRVRTIGKDMPLASYATKIDRLDAWVSDAHASKNYRSDHPAESLATF